MHKPSPSSAVTWEVSGWRLWAVLACMAGPLGASPLLEALPEELVETPARCSGVAESSAGASVSEPSSGEGDEAIWERHWRAVASHFAVVGERVYCALNFDRRYPNSLHVSVDQWIELNTRMEREIIGNLVRNTRVVPLREEAFVAAHALPEFGPEQYGHIHSAQVVEERGHEEMVVTDVWLIDAEQVSARKRADQDVADRVLQQQTETTRRLADRDRRDTTYRLNRAEAARGPMLTKDQAAREITERYRQREKALALQAATKKLQLRVVGFPTLGVIPGTRWTNNGEGAALVIVHDAPTGAAAGRGAPPAMLTAVNAELFARDQKAEEFEALLTSFGTSKAEFIAMARELSRVYGADPSVQLAHALQRKRSQAAVAEKPAAAPAPATASRAPASPAAVSPESPAPSAKAGDSDWFRQKYANRSAEAPAAARPPGRSAVTDGGSEPGRSSWFKEKYAKKDKKN